MNLPVLAALQAAAVLVVSPSGPFRTPSAALARARPGDTILIRGGVYREPPLVVTMPVTLLGESEPVLQGGGGTVLEIRADGVTVRGLVIRAVPGRVAQEHAGIRVTGSRGCRIEQNQIRAAQIGIHLLEATNCVIAHNDVAGDPTLRAAAGNAIHVWRSRDLLVQGNTVSGHRDGLYLEFVRGSTVRDNRSEGNLRYGLHFMFSDSSVYERNRFVRNGTGVAVMYSKRVTMTANRFEHSWGAAAYGLLLKDISDSRIAANTFETNTVGLHLEDANRNTIAGNRFHRNGTAVRVLANATDNRFTRNRFEGNAFDVTTNSRTVTSAFEGNWWDRYRGYDLDRDGVGDVPFRPVRLFGLIVEKYPVSLILLRSAFVELLDAAERMVPVLTPEALVDARPLMEPLR